MTGWLWFGEGIEIYNFIIFLLYTIIRSNENNVNVSQLDKLQLLKIIWVRLQLNQDQDVIELTVDWNLEVDFRTLRLEPVQFYMGELILGKVTSFSV